MPQKTLKDGSTPEDPRLDRIPLFDTASWNYRISDTLGAHQQQVVTRLWPAPEGTPVLNQGKDGACVGFGITNELLWYPVAVPDLDATFAVEQIYWPAQQADPWAGGAYPGARPEYEGTSLLCGIKTAADLGYYAEYRWAFTERELALGISHLGPAIIGVSWYKDMMDPDRDGFIHPTGRKMGGHCTLLIGIDAENDYYTLHNSWGRSWGDHGECKISRHDMADLQQVNGEACIITQRAEPREKPAVETATGIIG